MSDDELLPSIDETAPATVELQWRDALDCSFSVRGLHWLGENRPSYSRLPLRARGVVNETVWGLAQAPASAFIHFRSDTTILAVKATNQDAEVMPHMPASGSNGMALYTGVFPHIRLWQVTMPAAATYESTIFENVPSQVREFRLYLPLYKGLEKLEIGLMPDAHIEVAATPRLAKPVVFYGTSITQGGCANTAGTDYVSSIGRLLNLDVINLGFSGSGMGEPEMAEFIAEIDAALFVLDYATNAKPTLLQKTLPRFIEIVRAKHPYTPVLIMGPLCYSQYDYWQPVRRDLDEERRISMDVYVNLSRQGDENIHFVDGYGLIPFGTEAAYVDGVHPTDHGFQIIAQRLSQFIEQILLRDPGC